jgi:hypothetical protein
MAENVNAHRRDVQFQMVGSVLLSTQNLRFPVSTTCDKKFESRWIGPISVVGQLLIAVGTVSRASAPNISSYFTSILCSR